MIKKIFVFLLFVATVSGASLMNTVSQMGDNVREEIGVHDTSLLPDSTLNNLCKRAVLLTSDLYGGVEAQFRVLTVTGQNFYSIPDSITTILFSSLITSNGDVLEMRAFYPQFFQGVSQYGAGGNRFEKPVLYNYWADSLQLIPTPTSSNDTIVLKGYVRHSLYSDSTDSATPIDLIHAYKEVAFLHACYLVCDAISMDAEAQSYKADWKELGQMVSQTYARRHEQEVKDAQ